MTMLPFLARWKFSTGYIMVILLFVIVVELRGGL
jgi:hypothetical protein